MSSLNRCRWGESFRCVNTAPQQVPASRGTPREVLPFSQLWCPLDVSVAEFCLVEVTSKAPRPGVCTRQCFGREGFLPPNFGPSSLDRVPEGLARGGRAHGLLYLHHLHAARQRIPCGPGRPPWLSFGVSVWGWVWGFVLSEVT